MILMRTLRLLKIQIMYAFICAGGFRQTCVIDSVEPLDASNYTEYITNSSNWANDAWSEFHIISMVTYK